MIYHCNECGKDFTDKKRHIGETAHSKIEAIGDIDDDFMTGLVESLADSLERIAIALEKRNANIK